MSDLALDPALQTIVERVERVRRRLAFSRLLRWLATFLGATLVFVVAYAWLDHHLHFGPTLRILALILLGVGAVSGLFAFFRDIRRHVALEHAARFIEERGRYQQQLVASIEFYTQRENYPYSEDLARYMFRTVAHHTATVDWTSLVPRWPQRVCAAVILVGLGAFLWMAVTNGAYFGRYLARLTQPTATLAPLPATTLALTSDDIIVAEKTSFEMAAAIQGSLPETGLVIVTPAESTPPSELPEKRIELRPLADDVEGPRFALLTQLPLGDYDYHFEAGDARSAERKIRVLPLPELAGVSARINPPESLGMAAYEEIVEEGRLNVIEGATVTLTLSATIPLQSGTAREEDSDVTELEGAADTTLAYTFLADKPRSIAFSLTSADGLTNDAVAPVAVVLIKDEDPIFEYTSPGADYLATNVASIPLEMKIQDDFGLDAAALIVEIEGRPPHRIAAELSEGDKEVTLHHLLELEAYGLSVGDSILVHAEATDSHSGLKADTAATQSEVYFIEIRTYNQIVHQASLSMGGGANAPQGMQGERLPTLLQALEYTRAIMKKTWALQDAIPPNDEERRKAASTATDAALIASKLGLLKNRMAALLTAEQEIDMDLARSSLASTAQALEAEAPREALEPAKTAYRVMRKLADELEKGEIPPGSGSTRDLMEKIKLEEQVHLTRFEDEQVQWELKKMFEDLDRLREKQAELGRRFERFLLAQQEQEGHQQKITDEEVSVQENLYPESGNSNTAEGGGGSGSSRATKDGSLLPPTTASQGSGSGQQAAPEEMLEMLEAAQTDLEERTKQLEAELSAMAARASSGQKGASQGGVDGGESSPSENQEAARTATQRLAEARAAMKDLKDVARDAYFQSLSGEEAEKALREAQETVFTALEESSALVEGIINRNSRERTAIMLAAQAEAAAEIARALEQTNDPIVERRLQSELKELVATGHSGGSSYVKSFRGAGSPPGYVSLVDSIVPPADKSNIPAFIDQEPRRAARYLAEKLWTLAIDANKERGALRDNDTTDAGFSLPERAFFEATAQFKGEEGS